ncbi:response regulator [Pelagerythrobacter rhizovicinus]|uniref:Response regulator n=1 Tax=Pelagerythrobacter rhizovicinus TaxID=2268576 RepID=A0A4Q2KK25_9SPHN|nr:response regulator [Pelagerythrobacter rhizovicinus]RXZ65604.1 response regulator [Pelagerythrobacter rhizovicinus]
MNLPRILVAEDEFIVAFDLCDTVEEAGFQVEGPHSEISTAMLAVQKSRPDLAILDVELEDGDAFPLAEALMAENIPVIFHSGQFSPAEVRERYPSAIACAKPCPPNVMLEKVQKALKTH